MFKALFLTLALLATPALAQDRGPAPTSGFDPDKVEVHQQELLHGLDKISGRITLPDARAATLIQPAGPVWRDYRREYLPWLAAAAVLGVCALLALFYLIKGKMRIEGGRAASTILRFGAFERFMHWLTAASWCVLAISGLNVAVGRITLLPLLGQDHFSTVSAWLKLSHNFLAFPFTAGIILMFLVWLRHNIPNKVDLAWFKAGGGFIGDAHPPAGKFNGGQKVVFWIVVLGGGLVAISGFGLIFPFYWANITGMQLAQVVHGLVALAMIAAMLGHIYIGSVGMEGALDAMNTGEVDLNWAKAHHSLWVAEEMTRSHGSAIKPSAHPAE
jgi:formate dehydrogenase subunit gamma